ncbi:hypothetical protein GQ43DRAFT_291059 [Delitschia confertaspora ATCC 74209]|uniref:Uncharacterized protein n=1 Tax=Delitschia confertaspora ATCC 74209 TaxID=1513339 RepID=A0A9P4JPT1_9PLEO|nr:hypothetical protein GQ43DRAFT_291059 [Delitschia confertaspora ATCC 74209]
MIFYSTNQPHPSPRLIEVQIYSIKKQSHKPPEFDAQLLPQTQQNCTKTVILALRPHHNYSLSTPVPDPPSSPCLTALGMDLK